MKRKGIRNNSENLVGIKHKRDVLRIISNASASGKGITIMQIVKETKLKIPKRYGNQPGLTRQTVTKFVNTLIKEDQIIKFGNKYFVVDDIVDDGRLEFANYLESLLIMGLMPKFGLDSIQRIQKVGQSSEDNKIDDALFQIANRVGAFITYVLIEAMSPTAKIISRKMRKRTGLNFIETAISLPDLFNSFVKILPNEYTKDIIQGMEMREASYNKLSNTFGKVYPAIHKDIEEGYPEYFEVFYQDKDRYSTNCKHDWKEILAYKLGKRYRCTKCRRYEISPLTSN